MTALSIIYVVLFYVAMIILVGGIVNKIMQYKRVPAPLKIPVTPAPLTTGGVVYRQFNEVVFFNSLFRASKWTWLFGWIFHLSLLLAFFRHLRYAVSPDSFIWPLINLEVIQSFGKYAGFTMVIGLIGLFGRRIFVDRVRYISSASDYLMLVLIALIAISGLMMSFVTNTDILQ
nr:respiratory nitrate reductase subunit gamma [Gammaproteobacteria bacterium]